MSVLVSYDDGDVEELQARGAETCCGLSLLRVSGTLCSCRHGCALRPHTPPQRESALAARRDFLDRSYLQDPNKMAADTVAGVSSPVVSPSVCGRTCSTGDAAERIETHAAAAGATAPRGEAAALAAPLRPDQPGAARASRRKHEAPAHSAALPTAAAAESFPKRRRTSLPPRESPMPSSPSLLLPSLLPSPAAVPLGSSSAVAASAAAGAAAEPPPRALSLRPGAPYLANGVMFDRKSFLAVRFHCSRCNTPLRSQPLSLASLASATLRETSARLLALRDHSAQSASPLWLRGRSLSLRSLSCVSHDCPRPRPAVLSAGCARCRGRRWSCSHVGGCRLCAPSAARS